MELKLIHLISHEEIDTGAVPARDWRYLSVGGRCVLLIDSTGTPALFRLREDGEGLDAVSTFAPSAGYTCGAVSSVGERLLLCDTFGNVHTFPAEGQGENRIRTGVQMVAYGTSPVILDREGVVWARSRSAWNGNAWHSTELSRIYKLSAGREELSAMERNGCVHLTDASGAVTPDMERRARSLGRVTDLCETSLGVAVLREGRLYLGGRMVITGGGDLVSLSCGISDTLEFIVARRLDGSFLSVLLGSTPSPSSLLLDWVSQVQVFETGDRFLACLGNFRR